MRGRAMQADWGKAVEVSQQVGAGEGWGPHTILRPAHLPAAARHDSRVSNPAHTRTETLRFATCLPLQVTPLTKEHTQEVSDLFSPAKAAQRTAAEANAALSSSSGPAGELRPVADVYALGDCCANMGGFRTYQGLTRVLCTRRRVQGVQVLQMFIGGGCQARREVWKISGRREPDWEASPQPITTLGRACPVPSPVPHPPFPIPPPLQCPCRLPIPTRACPSSPPPPLPPRRHPAAPPGPGGRAAGQIPRSRIE